MPILYFAIYFAISIAITMLTAKNAQKKMQAGTIDENTLTQASQNKAFTLAFGTVEIPGNLVYYGGFSTFNIKEKVKTGFSSSKITVAIGYRLSTMVAFGYGEVDLLAVKSDKAVVFTNTVKGPFVKNIDLKNFYGDYKKEGGLSGDIYFYSGSTTQVCNQKFKSLVGVTNEKLIEYKRLSYCYFDNFYMGNSNNPQMFSYVIKRIPQFTFLPSEKSEIDGGCNPVNAIYDLLTNQIAGGNISDSSIDRQSFIAVHDKLFQERIGLNYAFEEATNVDDIIKQINDVTDANIILNKISPTNPTIKLSLNRNDYNIEDLLVFDESNIISFDKKTSNSEKTVVNQVVLSYKDISDNFTVKTVVFQNEANSNQIGTVRSTNLTYNELGNQDLANKVLFRKAMALTQQLSLINITVNRTAQNLEMGDVILVNLAKYRIDGIPFRIQEIDYGTVLNNEMKIVAIEDTQKTQDYIYSNATSKFEDINFKALNAESLFLETPYNLATISDENINLNRSQFISAIRSPNGIHLTYTIYSNDIAITDNDGFTPIARNLGIIYPQDLSIELVNDSSLANIVENTDFLNEVDLRDGLYSNLIAIKSGDSVEYCSFTNISERKLLNVKRGLFDTIPVQFSANSNIYFLGLDSQVTNTMFNKNTTSSLKTITMTDKDTLPLTDAVNNNITPAGRPNLPINVSNLKIKSSGSYINLYNNQSLLLPGQDIDINYSFRNRIKTVQFYTDVVNNNDQDVTATLKIFNNDILVATKTSNTTNIIFTNAEERTLNGGNLYSSLDFELTTVKSSLSSITTYKFRVTRS